MLPRKTGYNTNLMSFRYKVFNVLIEKFMFIRTIIAVIAVIGKKGLLWFMQKRQKI